MKDLHYIPSSDPVGRELLSLGGLSGLWTGGSEQSRRCNTMRRWKGQKVAEAAMKGTLHMLGDIF